MGVRLRRCVTFSMQKLSECVNQIRFCMHAGRPYTNACVSVFWVCACIVLEHVCRCIHLASVSDWATVCEA